MPQKSKVLDLLKLLGPAVAIFLAASGAWGLTQKRLTTVETKVETINSQGSAAFQHEKDKYYQQFLEIQKQLSSMNQSQLDMKEDLKEIKQHLNHR